MLAVSVDEQYLCATSLPNFALIRSLASSIDAYQGYIFIDAYGFIPLPETATERERERERGARQHSSTKENQKRNTAFRLKRPRELVKL